MAWDITVEFPLWGEDGQFPQDGFFYESGDQVNEKHLDALWNGTQTLQDETESALEDIDSDRDGIVDEADYANDSDASTYKGNDIDSDGDGVVDEAEFSQASADAAPSGVIAMWSGTTSDVPSGWTLCDGTDGTPDLRDRFIAGAGGQYAAGNTGGSDSVQLTESELPSHTHGVPFSADSNSTNTVISGNGVDYDNTVNSDPTGNDQAHENRPPYHALAFIMKL